MPPRATYRLQLRPGFGFDEAAGIADYLAALGVSHVYTSPYLQAAPGSLHGYDVVDHARVSDELGGPDAHARFVEALSRAGLGQVVDVVPNHMAIGPPDNRWWWDVLENGLSSRYAGHFDVDWDPPESRMRDRVLMPILGDHYGRVLERGEINVAWQPSGRFCVQYFDHTLPVAPESLGELLRGAARRCGSDGADQLAFIGRALERLPIATEFDRSVVDDRHRDREVLLASLDRLVADAPVVGDAVSAEVADLDADVDRLDALLDAQHYRLAYWRAAGDELDYRRFFDVDSLVALRVEMADVFADTHGLVLDWLATGEADGVRIDHPDGLRDPQAYFELLRAAAPDAWIVVEKILEPGERLPDGWPVDGTTGYDFCHLVTRLFHDARGEAPIRDLYAEVTGDATTYAEVVHDAKLTILREVLAADVGRVANSFVKVVEQHRRWRDFTRRELHETLVETAACFPVYRTYLGVSGTPTDADARAIAVALALAVARRPDLDPELFDLLGQILRAELDPGPGPATEVRLRFQQLTGAVMAKGVEDTVFYDHVPMASLNEVGADPQEFAVEPEEFHEAMIEAAARHPFSMLTVSTHDTKRSEDVRARLTLLSEIPGAWAEALRRWSTIVEPHRAAGEGVDGWPDPRMEHLLFQTLVGAHPLSVERAVEYMGKAVREARRNTSWTEPRADYDAAVARFVESVVADETFAADLEAFVGPLVAAGRVVSLAQKLLTLTAPGVPDIYQGTELWDLSLVDPDNRRPVDFDRRRSMLVELSELGSDDALAPGDDGASKLLVVSRTLALRAAHPDWFTAGDYTPMPATGSSARHVVAFARAARAISVVPRLPLGLVASGGWRDTTLELPPGEWFDVMTGSAWTGGDVPVAGLLGAFPVALLHHGGEPSGSRSIPRGGAWPN